MKQSIRPFVNFERLFCFYMNKVNEIWKDVLGYESIYEVSNFGNIKSKSRIVLKKGLHPFMCKEKILKPYLEKNGYLTVSLNKERCKNTRTIHQIVAIAFLNHIPSKMDIVINHKDFNKQNNHIENLELVTARENASYKQEHGSSSYIGVHWHKVAKKWRATIHINKKSKYLGIFDTEQEASECYQKALKTENK